MNVVRVLLVLLEGFCSFGLIVLILLQKSKGGGLGAALGGGGGDTLFGARAGNVLTRFTIILGVVFLANTLLLGIIYSGAETKSVVEKDLEKNPPATQTQNPAQPDTQATASGGVDNMVEPLEGGASESTK